MFPNWQADNTLYALVVHELGHVYGTGHIGQTIMTEELGSLILHHETYKELLVTIDGYQQLANSYPVKARGQLGLPVVPAKNGWPECRDEQAENFELLTGRKPVGTTRATIETNAADSFVLRVSDDAGEETIQISGYSWHHPGADARTFAHRVFFVAKDYDSEGHLGSVTAGHSSSVQYIQIHTRAGPLLNATYEFNLQSFVDRGSKKMNVNGHVIKIFSNRGPRILFASALYLAYEETSGPEYNDDQISCRL